MYRLACDRMPLWHYIDGCPLPEQCRKNKTTTIAKSVKLAGLSMDHAVEKCVYHLMNSSLHTMSRLDAIRAARGMDFHIYEEPTDDEAEDDKDKAEEDIEQRSPPRDRAAPSTNRAREVEQEEEFVPDPLVKGISDQASVLVAKSLATSSSASSDAESKREAKKCIADAEDAARMAQAIAQAAAQAFGDVAMELNRACHSMV